MIWIIVQFGLAAVNLGFYLASHQPISLFVAGFCCGCGVYTSLIEIMDRREW